MQRRSKVSHRMVPSLLLNVAVCLGSCLAITPAIAHKTEISGDVAGTWHIEPNHSPKAGQPAQVWIALTQQGGKVIPLNQCDCQLKVYRGSGTTKPVLEPTLQATTVEHYQGIPGAAVTFPQVGEYQLKLTGRSKGEANFQTFNLNYTVTVATGSPTANTVPAPQASAPSPVNTSAGGNETERTTTTANQPGLLGKSLIGFGAIALLFVGLWIFRQRSKETKG